MAVLVNYKTGETIEPSMSDEAAVQLCREHGDNFAKDLASKFPDVSQLQKFWLHKKALGIKAPQGIQLPAGAHDRIQELFRMVSGQLRYPKLRFQTSEGTLRLYLDRNRRINVRCADRSVGYVTSTDRFEFKTCPDSTLMLMKLIAVNPVIAASIWGRKMGRCCFCGLELTDERSVAVGYGPICADNWGLPWGEDIEGAKLDLDI